MMDAILPDALAWLVVLVIGAGWYFARKGRRIREAREKVELVQRRRLDLLIADASTSARKFGAFMEATLTARGADPGAIFDVSMLPYPKDYLRWALTLLYAVSPRQDERSAFAGGLTFLCQFQAGVGPSPLFTFGGPLDQMPHVERAQDDAAVYATVARIASWGDSADHDRWRKYSEQAAAEAVGIVDALGNLDRIWASEVAGPPAR